MSERKARWAMWSLGRIANRVIVEMRESDKYDIVAVCSSDIEKANSFIRENGLGMAQAYDDISEILKRDDVDIVYIASPPWLHKEQACRVMNAGKAVLVEKPMTLNAEDAVEIFDCAKKNDVFCAEGIWTNYFPAMKKMQQWINEGRIGDVVEVITTFGFAMIELRGPDGDPGWGGKMATGGGALSQFGCYNVNLSQYIYGGQPEAIYGKSQIIGGADGSDENTFFMLSYNGGAAHTMSSCSWSARTMSDSRISGTKGEIVIGRPFFAPFQADLYTHKDHFWYNDLEESFKDEYEDAGREGFKYQFEAISEYVLSGLKESPEVSHKYSIDLATTMENIRRTLNMI